MRPLSPQGIAEARKLFDQALDISPDYPRALIGRAAQDVSEDLFLRATIPLDKAEQLLVRAMELEPDDVDAKMIASLLYLAKGDLDRSALFAEQIIAIDPSYPIAYAILNKVREFQGRTNEALPLEEKAIRLSPHDPAISLWYRDLGVNYLYLGRDAEAVPWLEKAVAMNDKVLAYHKDLAAAYALTGRLDAAHKELEAVERLSPRQTIAKTVASAKRLSSNDTFRKLVDHEIAGLRLAGVPEN